MELRNLLWTAIGQSLLAEAFKEISRKVLFAKDHVENYRPISLLPIVSKLFERCVWNSIKDHLYQVISPRQHGFCTGRSFVLLEALDHIGSLLDSRELKQPRRLQKNNRFNDQNNSYARASRFLLHLIDVHCTITTGNLLI